MWPCLDHGFQELRISFLFFSNILKTIKLMYGEWNIMLRTEKPLIRWEGTNNVNICRDSVVSFWSITIYIYSRNINITTWFKMPLTRGIYDDQPYNSKYLIKFSNQYPSHYIYNYTYILISWIFFLFLFFSCCWFYGDLVYDSWTWRCNHIMSDFSKYFFFFWGEELFYANLGKENIDPCKPLPIKWLIFRVWLACNCEINIYIYIL